MQSEDLFPLDDVIVRAGELPQQLGLAAMVRVVVVQEEQALRQRHLTAMVARLA